MLVDEVGGGAWYHVREQADHDIIMALDEHEDYIRRRVVEERITHRQLSEEFKGLYPGRRGYSIRSIERFCQEKGIHKTCRLSEEDVEEAVIEAVSKVCTLMLNYWACPYHTGFVEDLCHTSYAKLKLVAYFFKLLGQEVISFWGRI